MWLLQGELILEDFVEEEFSLSQRLKDTKEVCRNQEQRK